MPEEGDVVDALRAAWRRLEPPAPDAELDAGLDAQDARTAAAVDWLRAAWRELEAPAPQQVPARRATHLFAGGPRRLAWLAAAAALLIASVPILRSALEVRDPAAPPAAVSKPTYLAALERDDGAIELREGPVRLVLLLPDPSPSVRDEPFTR